jgi:hypothetical protein
MDGGNVPRCGGMAFSSASSPSMSSASKPGVSIELLTSAAITTPVHWLWPGWLATGRLQILAGAPGACKTTIALSLAAAVSAGRRWPDGTPTQAGNIRSRSRRWPGHPRPAFPANPRLDPRHLAHQTVADADALDRAIYAAVATLNRERTVNPWVIQRISA